MKRKVIYHQGPTNSGKTYVALQRFMKAANGIYCSPLRLLAMEVSCFTCTCWGRVVWLLGFFIGLQTGLMRLLSGQVFDKVNAEGVYCNLHTGQEKKDVPFANHLTCTVEMSYLNRQWEVAVIDEIQVGLFLSAMPHFHTIQDT
jgi:ATP-dependent RNA helicase SUPV3L1/SUV3